MTKLLESQQITHCVICGKALTDKQIHRGTKTCCSHCRGIYRHSKPDNKENFCKIMQKVAKRPELRQKRSMYMTNVWQKDRDTRTAAIIEGRNRPEVKVKQAENLRKYKNSEEGRTKNQQRMRDIWADEEKSVNLRAALAKNNADINVRAKQYETQKRNKNSKSSKMEDASYELLCTYFNESDIVRWYVDKIRYPFRCDMYIKSLDVFIECNYGFEHQPDMGPFNANNSQHIDRLQELQKHSNAHKNPKRNRYKGAIYQWTDLDVRKRQYATDNKLNWYCIFTQEAFEQCIKELKGNNS